MSVDLYTLELTCQKFSDSDVGEIINIPGSFLIFEQELGEFATLKHRQKGISKYS